MKKVSREEFESFKKEVRERIEATNTKAQSFKSSLEEDLRKLDEKFKRTLKKLMEQASEIALINLSLAEAKNAIKMLEPRVDEVRNAQDTINILGKEIEDMLTERIALKTKISKLTKERDELKEE
jgi:peptidoglycan hydrolase CwlO-like protein